MKKDNSLIGKKFGQERSLGTVELGIPSWDKEPNTESGAPMRNKFSAQHDVSAEEAYRVVRGSTNSANIKKGGY